MIDADPKNGYEWHGFVLTNNTWRHKCAKTNDAYVVEFGAHQVNIDTNVPMR